MGIGRLPRRSEAIILLVAAVGVLTAAGEELPFFHITPENQDTPLPSASVQKVIQDSEGFIWMGFYSTGLARFDGRAFETFGTQDGLGDLTVREVLQDDLGYLWVGSESGLVVSDRPLPAYGVNEKVRFVDRVGMTLLRRGRVRRQRAVANCRHRLLPCRRRHGSSSLIGFLYPCLRSRPSYLWVESRTQ